MHKIEINVEVENVVLVVEKCIWFSLVLVKLSLCLQKVTSEGRASRNAEIFGRVAA